MEGEKGEEREREKKKKDVRREMRESGIGRGEREVRKEGCTGKARDRAQEKGEEEGDGRVDGG